MSSRSRTVYILCLVLVSAAVLAACGGALDAARSDLGAGDLASAERNARVAAAESPNDPEPQIVLAQIASAREDWTEADVHALEAVRLAPDRVDVHVLRADVLLRGRRPAAACEELQVIQEAQPAALSQLGPDPSQLLAEVAQAAIDSGQSGGALACYEALGALDPAAAEAVADKRLVAARAHVPALTRAGRYDEAIALLESLAADYPDQRGTSLLEKGKLELQLSRTEDAEASFGRYVDAAPDQVLERAGAVGRVFLGRDDASRAAPWLARAVADAPAGTRAHIDLARAGLRMGDGEAAREALSALQKAPVDVDLVLAGAEVAASEGFVGLALEVLTAALGTAPQAVDLVLAKAALHYIRGEAGEVETTLQTYADSEPPTADFARMADWAYERNYDQLARHYFERLSARDDAPRDLFLRLAQAQLAVAEYPEMEASLAEHVRRNEGTRDARYEAANVALEGLSYERALDFVLPAFEATPGDRGLAELVAETYAGLGDRNNEIATYERWARGAEDSAQAHLIIGQVFAGMGEDEKAFAALERASESPDVEPAALLEVGLLRWQRGEATEARAAFDGYVAAAPDEVEARTELFALYLRRLDSTDDAIRVGESMTSLAGTPSDVWVQLGLLHYAKGDDETAVARHLQFVASQDDPVTAARVVTTTARQLEPPYAERFTVALTTAPVEHPGFHLIRAEKLTMEAQSIGLEEFALASALRDEASAHYDAYLAAATPTDPWLYEFVVVAFRARDYQRAAKGLELGGDGLLNSPQRMETAAAAYVRSGRVDAAVAVYDRLVESAGEGQQPQRALTAGRELADAGHPGAAEPFLTRALTRDPAEVGLQAFQVIADLLIVTGRTDELEAAARDALERTRLEYGMREVIARTFVRAGLYDAALEHYRAMLQLRPNAVDVAAEIAALGFLTEDESAARETLDRFVERSPTPALAWTTIGDLYGERGELTLAAEAYERAIAASQLLPDQQLYMKLGELRARGADVEGAVAAFRSALELPGNPPEDYQRIVASLYAAQAVEPTETFASEAIAALDDPAFFLLVKVRLALGRGDRAAALIWADQYRARGGALPPLVETLIELGAFEAARELVDVEVDRGMSGAATRHLAALAPRAVLYDGLDRFVVFAGRVAASLTAPGELRRDIARRLADAGRREAALVAVGEQLRSSDASFDDALLRAALLLDAGLDADALQTVEAWFGSFPDARSTARAVRAAADVFVDSARFDAAIALYEAQLSRELSLVFPDLVGLVAEVHGPDAALDLVRGGPFAEAFESLAPPERVGVVADALATLARAGQTEAALELLDQLAIAQNEPSSLALVRVEVVALGGDAAAIEAAISSYRSANDSVEHDALLGHALARFGLEAALAPLDRVIDGDDDALAQRAMRDALAVARMHGLDVDGISARYIGGRFNRARAQLDVAAAMVASGDFDRAAARYADAARVLPSEATVFEGLAYAHHLRGDADGAVAATRKAANRRRERLETIEEAAGLFAQSASPAARELYAIALELEPATATLRLGLARQAWLTGELDLGDSEAAALVESSDRPSLARGALVGALLEADLVERAVAMADAIVADPNAGDTALWHAGVAFVRAERFDDGLAALERAADVSLASLEIQVATAQLFAAYGRLDQVERFLAKAVEARSDSPAPRLYRGLFRISGGDTEGALEDFALVRDSGYQPARALPLIGGALLAAGRPEAAADYLSTLLAARTVAAGPRIAAVLETYADNGAALDGVALVTNAVPGLLVQPQRRPEVVHALVVALVRGGRAADGLDLADRVVASAPDDALGWDARARALLALDQPAEAAAAAAQATRLASEDARYRFLGTLGRAQAARGDLTGAEATWQGAIRLGAGADPAWTATVYRALAWTAESGGDADLALAYRAAAGRAEGLAVEPEAVR